MLHAAAAPRPDALAKAPAPPPPLTAAQPAGHAAFSLCRPLSASPATTAAISDAAPHRHLALLSHLRRSHTRRRCFRHSPPPAPPPPRARRWRVGEERCGSGASAAASFRTPSARRASRWLANAPRPARWHRARGARCGDDALARRTLRPRADARREVAGGSRFLQAAKTEVVKERGFRAAERSAKRRGSPHRVGEALQRTTSGGDDPSPTSATNDGHGHPPTTECALVRVSSDQRRYSTPVVLTLRINSNL